MRRDDRRPGGATKAMQDRNQRIAARIDSLKVDEAVRFREAECPRLKWILERGALNNYYLRTCTVDGDLVILRVK